MTREELLKEVLNMRKFNYTLTPDEVFLEILKAINTEPIKHGQWIHEHLASTNGGSYAVVRCSNCLSQYPMTEENYCPHCGAQMDKVAE